MQLLEYFKEITIHPKNAEELKGLILQLAIQGKLTQKWREQNPDVEPSSVLLKKINDEKAHLIKKKKIKRENFSKIESSERYFNIPTNWVWSRLGEIGIIFNGNSVNKSVKEAKYSNLDSGYSYIATKDVGYISDVIVHNNGVKIPFDEPKFKIAKKGTVLICSEGGSAGKKMGITEEDCCFGNKLFAIHQFHGIEPFYILSFYGSKSFKVAFEENMTGIIGGISRNNFANLIIPIPPLDEQKVIVSIVNQLFKEVDELETQTKQRVKLKADFVTSALKQLAEAKEVNGEWIFLQQHFKTFFDTKDAVKKLRETILQLAVQGKLTSSWRSRHPKLAEGSHSASTLLEKIKAHKEQLIKVKKIKREMPLPEITEDEIPYILPDGWVWCRLGNLIKEKPRNGYSPKGVEYTTQTKSLKLGATTKGKFDSSQVKYLIETIPNDSYLRLKKNDILIQRSNSIEYVGVSAIYDGNDFEFVYPDLMMKLQACSAVNTKYLHYTLSSNMVRFYFRNKASGTSGNMPKINQTIVVNTLIPICSEEEQEAIVTKANNLMALCDQLEQKIEQNTLQVEDLMKSCLKEVFKN